jgi:hypothetical protein
MISRVAITSSLVFSWRFLGFRWLSVESLVSEFELASEHLTVHLLFPNNRVRKFNYMF